MDLEANRVEVKMEKMEIEAAAEMQRKSHDVTVEEMGRKLLEAECREKELRETVGGLRSQLSDSEEREKGLRGLLSEIEELDERLRSRLSEFEESKKGLRGRLSEIEKGLKVRLLESEEREKRLRAENVEAYGTIEKLKLQLSAAEAHIVAMLGRQKKEIEEAAEKQIKSSEEEMGRKLLEAESREKELREAVKSLEKQNYAAYKAAESVLKKYDDLVPMTVQLGNLVTAKIHGAVNLEKSGTVGSSRERANTSCSREIIDCDNETKPDEAALNVHEKIAASNDQRNKQKRTLLEGSVTTPNTKRRMLGNENEITQLERWSLGGGGGGGGADDDDDDDDYVPESSRARSSRGKTVGIKTIPSKRMYKKNLPDCYGADIFGAGLASPPKNPYFVSRSRTARRKNDLYIPKGVIVDYGLDIPENISLIDTQGTKWATKVKQWKDGRWWCTGGWRNLCNVNGINKDDTCICEFVQDEDSNEYCLLVRVVRDQV